MFVSRLWGKAATAASAILVIGGLIAPGVSYAADTSSVQIQICSGGLGFHATIGGSNQNWQTANVGPYNIPADGCTTFDGYWWKKGSRLTIGTIKPGDQFVRAFYPNVPNVNDAVAVVRITDNDRH